MKELIKSIDLLVAEELARANKKFPQFASAHEGYAILKEEIEEAEDEMNDVIQMLVSLWQKVKLNFSTKDNLKDIKQSAIKLAAESIQVAAMAQKFLDKLNADVECSTCKHYTEKLGGVCLIQQFGGCLGDGNPYTYYERIEKEINI